MADAAADAPNPRFEAHAEVSDGWERRANAVIIERARHLAGVDGRVLALTVRPLPSEDPPSVTDDLAGRAAALGWPVLTLDPRAPGRRSRSGDVVGQDTATRQARRVIASTPA